MISICLFNNKGGVGKTTLLCNLSSYLAIEHNKKVLVVDADPQCNATAYILPEEQLDKLYLTSKDGGTINELITSLRRSKGYADIPIVRSHNFSVDLVPGDPNFSLAEDFLAKDWIDAVGGEARGLKTTFFFKALLNWAEKQSYDFVFFDVGPSLGAINRTVLLSCDYFLLPMSSDIFSLRGLQNISIALNNWKKGLGRGLATYAEDNQEIFSFMDGINEPNNNIKFIGYVTQQYTTKTVDGKKRPVIAYDKIIKKMGPAIQKHLIEGFNEGTKLDYKLGEIPYFQSLVPMSQSSNKPIFLLKSADGVVGAHFDKVKQFGGVIGVITLNLLKNIQKFDSDNHKEI